MNVIERFKKGRAVQTRVGLKEIGSFIQIPGENFYRRVNSDGTLTLVSVTNNRKFTWKQPNGKLVLTKLRFLVSSPKPNVGKVSNNLWEFENDRNEGYRNGKYYPHTTKNGNLDVANGIDLQKNPLYLGEANRGISKERADLISSLILELELPYIDKALSKYTNRPDTISPQMKEGLLDMYWQAKNGLYEYNNLFKSIATGNLPLILRESKMYYKDRSGKNVLDERRWESRKKNYFHY